MTQTTLYSDKKLFLSFYKNALRRIRGIGIIYLLLSFITFPMPYIMEIENAMYRLEQGWSMRVFNGEPQIYTALSAVLYFAIIILAAVLISAYINSFMHSKKAVDVFHALPVRRPQMLMANFAAAATVMLSVQFVCYAVIMAVNSVTVKQPIGDIFLEMLRVALLTLVIMAIAFFCCVCCNTGLDSVVFTGALLAIVPAYTGLVIWLMDRFLEGFVARDEWLYTSVKFSPAVMMYETFFRDDMAQTLLLSGIYIVFAVALMAVSCMLYTRRKSEIAQSASTKSLLYQFILLAASVGGGIFFGMAYSEVFGNGEGFIQLTAISCVFTVAIYLVFNGVVSRNPRPSKRGLVGLAVSLVLTVAFIFTLNTGFFGFETYIPDMDDIQSVSIDYAGDYAEIGHAHINVTGGISHRYNSYLDVKFTNPDEIRMVRNIHGTITDAIDKTGVERIYYNNINIAYTLKNGKTVYRMYNNDVPFAIVKQLVALEDLESFKTQLYPAFTTPVEYVKAFNIKDGFGNNDHQHKLDEEKREILYNAIMQDTLNTTRQMKDQRTGPVLARIEIVYEDRTDKVLEYLLEKQLYEADDSSSFGVKTATAEIAVDKYYAANIEKLTTAIHTNVIFDVTEDCINTIAALKEIGLEEYTVFAIPEDVKAVVTTSAYPYFENRYDPYWHTNRYYNNFNFTDNLRWEDHARVKEYTDAQQVEQLVESSRVSLYGPAQTESFYVVVFMDKDVDYRINETQEYESMAYYISANDVPDFVKTDFNKYIEYIQITSK